LLSKTKQLRQILLFNKKKNTLDMHQSHINPINTKANVLLTFNNCMIEDITDTSKQSNTTSDDDFTTVTERKRKWVLIYTDKTLTNRVSI
jgi:hypothetical protein